MANIVTNLMRIEGEREAIKRVFAWISKGDKLIDFNQIIPLPFLLAQIDSLGIYSKERWGTRGNAFNQSIGNYLNEIKFETAWNTPMFVLEALSSLCPEISVHVQYTNEHLGESVGEYVCKNGVITEHKDLSGTKEGMLLGARLMELTEDDLRERGYDSDFNDIEDES